MQEATLDCAIGGQNGLMRAVAPRIKAEGTLQRGMVDTAQQNDRQLWEDFAARAIGVPVPYRPARHRCLPHQCDQVEKQ
jgi:hypothetical protein